MNNKVYFDILINLAKKAYVKDEVPVAALIVKNNKIIARSINKRNKSCNLLGHAEISCIIKACKKIKDWRLDDCTMYVTLEPCHMCKEIIKESRIKKVYYLSSAHKLINYKTSFIKECKYKNNYSDLLTNFFENKRK